VVMYASDENESVVARQHVHYKRPSAAAPTVYTLRLWLLPGMPGECKMGPRVRKV
jgi:hypothetical protein